MTQKNMVTSGTLFKAGRGPAGLLYVSSAIREASSFTGISFPVGEFLSFLLSLASRVAGNAAFAMAA
jgi:hypothetical protein